MLQREPVRATGPAEPVPGCYLLVGELCVVLGCVDGSSTRLVSYLRADGRAPMLVLEAWPRAAQPLSGALADGVLWLAQQARIAGHNAAVRDTEAAYAESSAYLRCFRELAQRLAVEVTRG